MRESSAAFVPVRTGVTLHQPVAFWLGTAAITLGVLMHMPDYLRSSSMHYHMEGMVMSPVMYVGMALILGGMAAAAFGLIPFRSWAAAKPSRLSGVHIHAMDQATLTPAHWGLLFVLGVALIVDVMKPATLGFVVPGMKGEYGLTTRQIALLPFVALGGTTLGSFLWGILSDRIGRRAAILLASLMFIGTSICGFMPAYGWNLLMCFLMGVSAGGMLPIVYALMAESIPAKRRGWLVVLHAGMGTVGGYLVASGLAALLEPEWTWRILWLPGLPTGLLVLLLNRWIPESPRFLLEHGRVKEAEAVMARYGVVMDRVETPPVEELLPEAVTTESTRGGWRLLQLFRPPFLPQTLTVTAYGLGWGLVNWGFLTFIPAILQDRGLESTLASRLLFTSALLAIPGTIIVAYLYGMWSSRRTMILFALLTAVSLFGFAMFDPGAGSSGMGWLTPLMVLLLVGSGGVISMLSPYTAEVYPTHLRGTGSGLAAGSSKLGGIVGPPVVAVVLGLSPGFGALAVVMALPICLSAGLLAVTGIETKGRALTEEIVSVGG